VGRKRCSPRRVFVDRFPEEEVVITYTRAIDEAQRKIHDLIIYIRADEAKHREVNHTLATRWPTLILTGSNIAIRPSHIQARGSVTYGKHAGRKGRSSGEYIIKLSENLKQHSGDIVNKNCKGRGAIPFPNPLQTYPPIDLT
jgi:hypothetical protein